MADTTAQVRRVAARLRGRGFTVVEVPGWETRGKGPMTTRGRVEHHTAGPATGAAPSLRVCTFGRAGLRNSLCRWFVSRPGVIYLVAAGVSWHAGAGVKGSNTTLSGTEAEHSGSAAEPWSAASLSAQAAISQEEAREFGFPTAAVWDHREHAPSRKVDRTGIDSARWRARLAGAVGTIEEDQMRQGDNTPAEDVSAWQHRLREWAGITTVTVDGKQREVTVDGDFGPVTAAATREWQKRAGLAQTGAATLMTVALLVDTRSRNELTDHVRADGLHGGGGGGHTHRATITLS